jgi:hypothetical protein
MHFTFDSVNTKKKSKDNNFEHKRVSDSSAYVSQQKSIRQTKLKTFTARNSM